MNSDFKELLQSFATHKVRYLVVGGYADMHYSQPRFTKDLDLLAGRPQDLSDLAEIDRTGQKSNSS